MKSIDSYSLHRPVFLDEGFEDLQELELVLIEEGKDLEYWVQEYHSSKPELDFLDEFEDLMLAETEEEERSEEEEAAFLEHLEARMAEIEDGSPLTEVEAKVYDEWAEKQRMSDVAFGLTFTKEHPERERYWIRYTSPMGETKWIYGPFPTVKRAASGAARKCPWIFATCLEDSEFIVPKRLRPPAPALTA